MEEFPPEITARVQHLEQLAKRGSNGTLTQADSDALLNVIRRLFAPDTEHAAAPTAQDPGISKAIISAHQATGAALALQTKDPDNNSDPVDKKVLATLQTAHNALTEAMAHQAKDGTPDAPVGGDDGTQSTDVPSGATSGDGTGTRAALRLELDMVKMRRAGVKPSIAVDYDGTWALAPGLFSKLGKALARPVARSPSSRATATLRPRSRTTATTSPSTSVVVVKSTDPADVAAEKADWLKTNKADLLIDNNAANVTAASAVANAALFVPQQPKKEKKAVDLAAELRSLRHSQ